MVYSHSFRYFADWYVQNVNHAYYVLIIRCYCLNFCVIASTTCRVLFESLTCNLDVYSDDHASPVMYVVLEYHPSVHVLGFYHA